MWKGVTQASTRFARRCVSKTLTFVSWPIVVMGASPAPKKVSAMMRVRDEEEYLLLAVNSILDVVDEVVMIDNGSTDATPDIIAELQRDHPGKVRSLEYPHVVARYGSENRELASTRRGRRSPSLLANFYNWSMAQCRYDYILKWDGDTIATPRFREDLLAFKRPAPSRRASKQALWFVGANLHPDLRHLIRGLPYEPSEPRLVARRFAKYTNYLGYCEGIESPYIRRFPQFSEVLEHTGYLHMKFCKQHRYSHMSDDLKPLFTDGGDVVGDPISTEVASAIEELGLAPRAAEER